MKVCKVCKQEKELTEFYYHNKLHYYSNACKRCACDKICKEAKEKRRIAREARKAAKLEQPIIHPETKTCSKCSQTLSINNFIMDKRRNNYSAHCRQCQRHLVNKWYERNSSAILSKMREARCTPEHREKRRRWNRLYTTRRLKIDKVYALKKHVRATIRNAFIRKGYAKSDKAEAILGCSIDQLYVHFNVSAFESIDGMHIDHICPIAQAKTEEEVIKLNHHTNLRLIPASENLSKSDSRTPEGEELCQILLGRPWLEPTLPQQPLDIAPSPCYNI